MDNVEASGKVGNGAKDKGQKKKGKGQGYQGKSGRERQPWNPVAGSGKPEGRAEEGEGGEGVKRLPKKRVALLLG